MVAVQSNRSRIVLVSGSNRRPNCNHRINGILQTIMPAIKTHHSITVDTVVRFVHLQIWNSDFLFFLNSYF